jgi:hypothetical protein
MKGDPEMVEITLGLFVIGGIAYALATIMR